jgi:HAD superfamily hydrolase (TIGR01509 family)
LPALVSAVSLLLDAILLDLDGVLIDSGEATFELYKRLFRKFSLPEPSHGVWFANRGLPAKPMLALLLPEGKKNDAALIGKMNEEMVPVSISLIPEIKLFGGVREFLEAARGISKAVVTNRRLLTTNTILEYNDLDGFFKAVVAGDMVERQKPFPDPLLLALKKLGVKKQGAVYVGDTILDVQAGKAAGIRTVIVHNRLEGAECVSSFKELQALLGI